MTNENIEIILNKISNIAVLRLLARKQIFRQKMRSKNIGKHSHLSINKRRLNLSVYLMTDIKYKPRDFS